MAKVLYRGHEISVTREKSMAGYGMLYYSIFRQRDQLECLSSQEDSAEKVQDKVEQLKGRIDSELESDDPWDEKAKLKAAGFWDDAAGYSKAILPPGPCVSSRPLSGFVRKPRETDAKTSGFSRFSTVSRTTMDRI